MTRPTEEVSLVPQASPIRNVMVTGGTRGIGLAIARRLTQAGFRVLAVARKATAEFQQAAGAAPAGVLEFLPFDLAQVDSIPVLMKNARKQYGPLFGLVNNAGMSAEGALALMPTAQIEQVIRLNTLSPIVVTKHAVRAMMSDGGGRIVNVSSITAFTGYSGLAVYSASKASLVGFTRSLAREVGRMGVTVNAIAPGFVDTDMTYAMKEEDRDRIVRRSPLRRLVEATDIAHAVEYLMGEGARNITGTVITVDAGSTA